MNELNIKEQISKIVEKLTKSPDLLEQFRSDPIKAVKGIIGVNIPIDSLNAIVEGVKAKIFANKSADALGALKKLF